MIGVPGSQGDPFFVIRSRLGPFFGIINENRAFIFSDDFKAVTCHDNGNIFIDADAEQAGAVELFLHDALWVFEDFDEVFLATSCHHVLIDGGISQEPESPLHVTNHDGVAAGIAAGKEGSLNSSSCGGTTDDSASREDLVEFLFRSCSSVGLGESPLSSASEPDAGCLGDGFGKFSGVSDFPVMCVKHGDIEDLQLFSGEAG